MKKNSSRIKSIIKYPKNMDVIKGMMKISHAVISQKQE